VDGDLAGSEGELCYRQRPGAETLGQWDEVVRETADFMVSYAMGDESGGYFLGQPVTAVQENNDTLTTRNPVFELTYWRFGL
jgi:hypothetical protein